MMKYLLAVAMVITALFLWVNIAQGHGGGPHGGNPLPPPLPPDYVPLPPSQGNTPTQPGKPPTPVYVPPPFISTEGITYDFFGGLIQPVIKEQVTSTGTASVDLYNPELIGIEMLNNYFIPYDTYQLSSLTGVTLPGPNKKDIISPTVPALLRQHLIVAVLQTMSYIEICSEAACAEYLIEIAQPSLLAAKTTRDLPGSLLGAWLRDKTIGKRIAGHVMEAIGDPAAQPPPAIIKGTNNYGANNRETMINRLIMEELGKCYYFPGNDMGRCLKEMGPEAMPYVINAAKNSTHSLIKRNAVALLGYYKTPAASNTLRELFIENIEKDKVVRNRALAALVNRRDAKIAPVLITTLKNSKDTYFKTLAAYALGLLGDKEAIKPLTDYIDADPNNRDVLWAAIQSLGLLCNETHEDIKKRLNLLIFKKLQVTRHFAWVALYAMGDKAAADYLELKPSKNLLQKVQYPILYFTLRVLSKKGEPGIEILLSIVTNRGYDTKVRFAAMTQTRFTEKHIPMLKELIADPITPAILKAYGLYVLLTLRERDMAAISEQVLKDSFKGILKKGVKIDGEGFDTVVAIRILSMYNANKEALLQEAITKYLESIKSRLPQDRDYGYLLAKPPVIEAALEELGLFKSEEAAQILLDTAKQSNPHYRGKAVLMLANMPAKKNTVKTMMEMLSDEDGWNRYCAYSALKRITGQDFNCEWVYDPAPTRKETVQRWEKWWSETGSAQYK